MGMLWVYIINYIGKEHPHKMKTIIDMAKHMKNQYLDLPYFWQFAIGCTIAFFIIALGIAIFN